ncbi:FAD-binding and (Fe-S)-binding domain-containing protein [Croceivirga sp. JEA036]|uniref:FAD-binding and (Fe-S)-binding domain-containing protein n=1 Tax=Croceivirga sp. JEA036 TaxID=2721162 RepID=UPI00143BDEFD|nr:FAD-binding and (Fe-S)-binding domain-containing protein [Croceivirga sp. JEA036]NJB35719.1 FAD-binding protein [Croceivirga sp. JEA036]
MDKNILKKFSESFIGDFQYDALVRTLYATDASVYRKLPTAVAFPKNDEGLIQLLQFANTHKIGLIPRTAGTSLAGQCVGEGIVVDTSRYFTQILTLDVANKTVTVQPGVVRDELNMYLKPHGLQFGPNTSTSNRCMIGGMVGNNSSGTTSIQSGVTRDTIISMKTILADGTRAEFKDISAEEYEQKTKLNTLEGKIYAALKTELGNPVVKEEILKEFPEPSIHRRNTGYAVDELLFNSVFGKEDKPFNLCKLLSGSEGTLAFTTEITLQLETLPPAHAAMVCTHYKTLEDCLTDVVPVMKHDLFLCEMMDKTILDCTKNNRQQLANRFFVEGDPEGLLMLEVRAHSSEELEQKIHDLVNTVEASGLSYAQPVLYGADIQKAVELRKAGLGLLGNMVGDKKAVACIEDTAVALDVLKPFIMEFSAIMDKYQQSAVYYAHAGAGELHLRPILNLKEKEDVVLFRKITTDVAYLTKKYKGSFSGEHGDGIVRAEFIPIMIGQKNYELLKRVKAYFDPNHILNPGKIVDAYPMDASLRYVVDRKEPEISTLLDFSDSQGILRAAEKCNGSGDCRKTELSKGAMCPSYHATKQEKDTTRGRANVLREFLTNSDKPNRFNHTELKEVFDLCLSCKACSSECPSNVDVATLKSEFQYQYQEANGYSLRSKLFAHNTKINAFNSKMAALVNATYKSPIGTLVKKLSGVAVERELPPVYKFNFDTFLAQQEQNTTGQKVVLFIDEFTKYLDVTVGQDAIVLLTKLGYQVELFYGDSGRTYLSKGFLKQAKELANKNIAALTAFTDQGLSIVGIEPSSILSFRDEYSRLAEDKLQAEKLASHSLLIEEFLAAEIALNRITASSFTKEAKEIKIHGHCHQKSLSNQKVTFDVLNLPENYKVAIIPSGCCGMAGSFGYEKEHYQISMKVGETKLFPAVRKTGSSTVIAANGTSCRHQIKDGTGRHALHPVTILRSALIV